MHLVAALKGTHVEVVAVACGVGVALLLGCLEDSGLAGHGEGVDGGVRGLAVGADAPAQLEVLKAEAHPAVELDHTRAFLDGDSPVGALVDRLGVVGAQDLVLDLIQAGLADGLLGVLPVGVAAVAGSVGRGGLLLGLGLGGVGRLPNCSLIGCVLGGGLGLGDGFAISLGGVGHLLVGLGLIGCLRICCDRGLGRIRGYRITACTGGKNQHKNRKNG